MADTQWPRYYVFELPDETKDWVHAGSVHAPDAEMALLIARDVFGRRPERRAMWVLPDREITARTAQELAAQPPEPEPEVRQPVESAFHIFGKPNQRSAFVALGIIQASSPEHALAAALAQFGSQAAVAWWVFPDSALNKSSEEDTAELFASSPGKPYRHERDYPVRTMMRALRKKKRGRGTAG